MIQTDRQTYRQTKYTYEYVYTTGCPQKNFAVRVLAAEGTMIVQFSQSRCHLRKLFIFTSAISRFTFFLSRSQFFLTTTALSISQKFKNLSKLKSFCPDGLDQICLMKIPIDFQKKEIFLDIFVNWTKFLRTIGNP